eukprot:c16297_g1_i1.p2 GENE.c16297_g1_i1~~c16297_g1_i1.p2  ORF type:complete len:212 (-),score=5.92 c16297_g1_i1:158-793(-)
MWGDTPMRNGLVPWKVSHCPPLLSPARSRPWIPHACLVGRRLAFPSATEHQASATPIGVSSPCAWEKWSDAEKQSGICDGTRTTTASGSDEKKTCVWGCESAFGACGVESANENESAIWIENVIQTFGDDGLGLGHGHGRRGHGLGSPDIPVPNDLIGHNGSTHPGAHRLLLRRHLLLNSRAERPILQQSSYSKWNGHRKNILRPLRPFGR